MKFYNVTGMSCAACSARVEKAVRGVAGVTDCSVSLLTNSMGVEGNADADAVISAVVSAGYGATLRDTRKKTESVEEVDPLKDTESPKLLRRFLISVFFLLALMYISMGAMMWNFPLPVFLAKNPLAIGLCQLLLSAVLLGINQRFLSVG